MSISIIIPVYNSSRYIGKCIDSIVAQTFVNWELVLVDDGSSDNSGSIIDQYAATDPRIKAYHQTNQGASAARNYGLDVATGQWVTFVDSDDYLGPDYLKHLYDNSNDCDIVINGWNINGRDVRLEPRTLERESFIDIFRWRENLGFVCSKLYRKKMLDSHGIRFAKDVCWSEDLMMFHDAVRHADSIRIASDADYYYVQHPGSSIMRIHSYEQELTGYLEARKRLDLLCESISPDVEYCFNPYAFLWRTVRAAYREPISRRERLSRLRSLPVETARLHNRPTHRMEAVLTWLVRHKCWRIVDLLMSRIESK